MLKMHKVGLKTINMLRRA